MASSAEQSPAASTQASSDPTRDDPLRSYGAPDPAHSREQAPLGDRDLEILAFEHQWWRHAGAKEEAIRSQFGLSAARYYQLLNALIDTPAAVVHDPMLVRRLQRVRDARTDARSSRTTRTP